MRRFLSRAEHDWLVFHSFVNFVPVINISICFVANPIILSVLSEFLDENLIYTELSVSKTFHKCCRKVFAL